MSYYSVSFGYRGPTSNFPTEKPDGSRSDASLALSNADAVCEAALKELELEFLHAYAWTDGSLYKYVKDPRSKEELHRLLASVLSDSENTWVSRIDEVAPTSNPWKGGVKTVGEYFLRHGERGL